MSTVIDLRGRHLLTLNDYSPERAHPPARPRRRPQGGEARGPRAAAPGGEGDRADLREGLDAHALRVRGRGLRPGRARDLHRAERLAHGRKETVKDTARVLGRMYDAIEYRGYGEDVAEELAEWAGRPGLQRADRRVASDAGPRRLPDRSASTSPSRSTRSPSATSATRASTWRTATSSAARSSAWTCASRRRGRSGRRTRSSRSRARSPRRPGARITITEDVAEAVRAATCSSPTSGSRWASPPRRGRSGSSC